MNKARVESFSDGVFAFAITLLVLGVQVPELKSGADKELQAALIHSISQLLPYVTSFATIGIIWLNHHAMFHSVERVEHTTLTLNLLLLLVVSFIPYPTAVLSRYGTLPSSTFLYGVVLSMLGITYSLLWLHVVRSGLTSARIDKRTARHKTWCNLAGTLTYSTAALIALRFPRVSVLIYFLVAVFYFIPTWRSADVQKR